MGHQFLELSILLLLAVSFTEATPISTYTELRNTLINQEKDMAFGGQIKLTGDEISANMCLMKAKWEEVDNAFKSPSKFLPTQMFFKARENIEKSEIFKIIQEMPKGALLHAHSSAITSLDFVVDKLTYEPNLYICRDGKALQFRFFKKPDNKCKWQLLSDVRKTEPKIDEEIKHNLQLEEEDYGDVNALWDKVESSIGVLKGLVTYRPLFEKFLYEAMQELYDDNVMLMELRTSMSPLYEIDGSTHDTASVIKIYKEVSDRFVKDHPGFFGIKIIYAPYRKVSPPAFDKYMETFRQMKAAYPDFIIGFDLVGQEDLGHPLVNFAGKLLELGKETPFFFHAGETSWFGHSTDQNLYDALLLNTKRIGHGFALLKHPKLMELVKQKNIAIELNPISNQLSLVKDLRNHPASTFFAENLPVVVSNDDPNILGSKGLSYDFYETFVGIMSRDADLKALKQLALNSITYSGLNQQEREAALKFWNGAWSKFVKSLAGRCKKH